MGGYTKEEILGAVVQALRPLETAAGGYVRMVAESGAGLRPEEMRQEAVRLPAVFVSHSSSTFATRQYLHMTETVGVEVTAVSNTGMEPGAGRMLEDVRGILCGSTLGLDITPLALLRESREVIGSQTTVETAYYSLRQSIPIGGQSQST